MRRTVCLLLAAAPIVSGLACTTGICDPANRIGKYALTFTRDTGDAGGTCPVPSPRTLQIDEPADWAGAPSCTVNEGGLNASYCKQGVDVTCMVEGGGSLHFVGVLTDTDGNGKNLTGVEQVTYTGTANDCEGTFDFVGKRQ